MQAPELDAEIDRYLDTIGTTARTSGVTIGDGASLVMLEAQQGRDRLVRDGDGFVTRRSRGRITLADLKDIAATEPARLSPNVLLRPVLESALLPTVAYLGGPGELRYLAITPPIYQHLDVHRQKPLPRWSGVLVEPRVDRVLDKFGITLDDLAAPAGSLESRLVRAQLPPEAHDALASLRAALDQGYRRLHDIAVEIDPTLDRSIQGVQQQALSWDPGCGAEAGAASQEDGRRPNSPSLVVPARRCSPRESLRSASSRWHRFSPDSVRGCLPACRTRSRDGMPMALKGRRNRHRLDPCRSSSS